MSASCVECLCENDLGCGSNERCDTATGKCIKVDAGVAYPVDGSVVGPDGSDGGVCGDPSDCDLGTEPICDDSSHQCRACANSTDCSEQHPTLPACNTETGACVECYVSEDDCEGVQPICDPASFQCRGCINNVDCQTNLTGLSACASDFSCVGCTDSVLHCSGNTPICELATTTCRACTAHSDCDTLAGGVCDYATGACVPESEIIYVDGQNCPVIGDGSRSEPYCVLQDGVNAASSAKPIVWVADGTYFALAVSGTKDVWVVGAGPAVQIQNLAPSSQVLVTGTARLVLENFIIGAPVSDGIGVECSGTSGDFPTIELHRNRIIENTDGGVSLRDCNFRVYNNIIAGNSGTIFGGVRIDSTATMAEFWHNTVTANLVGGSNPGGVYCATSVDIHSSIVVDNVGDELSNTCNVFYSMIDDGTGGTGSNNITGSPVFIAPSSGDYHLSPVSDGIDDGDPGTTATQDIDGDDRFQGAAPDMGADEVNQ